MLKLLVSIVSISFLLTACQKEVSVQQQRRTNSDSSMAGLLKKQVATNLSDNFESAVLEYVYDNSNLLKGWESKVNIPDASGNVTIRKESRKYHRDNNGKITRVGDLTDSIYLLVEYENNSSRVKRVFDNRDIFYTEFVYNSENRIEQLRFFQRFPATTDPYKLMSYHTHKFDANGNLTEKIYNQDDDSDGDFETPLKIYFYYDNKVNPLFPIDEPLFNDYWSLTSPNNTLRQINEYSPGGIVTKDTINYVYTYNVDGRPVTLIKDAESKTEFFYY